MEVVPSLYNLLVRLKNEGYNVGKLPANPQELAKMIQAQGAVFGTYAVSLYPIPPVGTSSPGYRPAVCRMDTEGFV